MRKIQAMKKGFTLVELSIVLVIIGLLIGGILVAQSLIDSAKQNSIIKELEQHNIMVSLFKERFKYYPGDYPNPTFSDAHGDGDDFIDNSSGDCTPSFVGNCPHTEFINLWHNLYAAGFISKPMIQATKSTSGAGGLIVGTSVPFSSVDKSNYLRASGAASDGGLWNMMYTSVSQAGKNFIFYVRNYAANDSYPSGSMDAVTAYAIDKKIDDGMPNTGDIIGVTPDEQDPILTGGATWANDTCQTGTNRWNPDIRSDSSAYNLDSAYSSHKNCVIGMKFRAM